MKNLKKLVSVIVTVAMLVSSLAALSVSAAYPDVDANNSYAKAIEVLSGLGVVKGDDEGNFNPTNNIKRSEMVALICRMMGEEEIATSTGSKFDDVAENHWANGYINWGVDSDIIKGDGDGNFRPDDNVTYQDALVMIDRALGYERIALREENGGYPGGYVKVAKQHGVTANITFNNEKAATREVVAQAIYNGLTAPICDVSFYGAKPEDDEYVIYNGKNGTALRTLLTWTNQISKVKASVENTAKTDATNLLKDIEAPQVELKLLGSYDYAWASILDGTYGLNSTIKPYVGETAIADYMGYTVEAYIAEDDNGDWVVKAVAVDGKSTDEETITEVDDQAIVSGDVYEYYANINDVKTTKIDLASTRSIYYNGSLLDGTQISGRGGEQAILRAANKITFMGPKNADYNKIFVTDYVYKQVESLRADDLFVKFTSGSLTLDAEERNDETFIYNLYDAEGNVITLDDVNEDDIFNIAAPVDATGAVDIYTAPYMDIYVTNKTVTGTVSELRSGKYVIDGVAYDVATTVNVGDEGTFFLTIDDVIYEKDASASTAKDFGFIVGAEVSASFGTNTATIRMWTEDGKVANYTVAASLRVKGADVLYASYPAEATFKRTGTVDGTTSFLQTAIINETQSTAGTAYIDLLLDDATEVNAKAKIAKRLVAYKLNSAGEISELIFAGAGSTRPIIVGSAAARSYNPDINTFGGIDLDNNSKLIVAKVTGTSAMSDWNVDEDDVEIAAFDALDEDLTYNSFLYNFNGEDTLGVALFDAAPSVGVVKSHLAVVTEIGTTADADGLTVSSYTLLQGGEEVTLKADYDELNGSTGWGLGDVVQYAVNPENEIVEVNTIYDANGANGSRFNDQYDGNTYNMANLATRKLAFVYGITTEVKNGAMVIDSTVGDGTGSTYRARLNETEGNTYALVNKLTVARKQDVSKLSSADAVKESYSSVYYLAIAVVNDDGRYEDVVQIKIDNPQLVDDGSAGYTDDVNVSLADVTYFLGTVL